MRNLHAQPAHVDVPRALLERLAPREPINDAERGGCVMCGGRPPGQRYGYAERDREHHLPGCAWVAARELLGDALTATSDPALSEKLRERAAALADGMNGAGDQAARELLAQADRIDAGELV